TQIYTLSYTTLFRSSNVTLGGNSKKILAADSVTIFNNVVVTIGGEALADVFTNHPNYTGFGGNGSTTGTFAGAGANRPRPLSDRSEEHTSELQSRSD